MKLTYIAISLWALSLFMPVYVETKRPDSVAYGLSMLVGGAFGPLIFQFGWIGNIALPMAAGLPYSRWPRYACALAFANSLFWTHVVDDVGHHQITHLIGYYIWMAAMFICALSLLHLRNANNNQNGIAVVTQAAEIPLLQRCVFGEFEIPHLCSRVGIPMSAFAHL